MNRFRSVVLAAIVAFAVAVPLGTSGTSATTGGPVTLLGIDAEDGGVGGHGPLSSYTTALDALLGNVTNGGSGLLVFGCTPAGTDDVSTWWAALGAASSQTVTCVETAAGIAGQSLAGFAVIGVASDEVNTFSGGLTQAENDALAARGADIAAFVNGGGGLFGLASSGFTNPYAYLGGIGAFTFNFPGQFSDITPTPDGITNGITDALDVCCWHDEYLTYPSFLKVLATNAGSGNAVALGGAKVVVEPVVVKINKYGGPMCADKRKAVRVDLVVRPRSGTTVVSVSDPFMVLTKIEKAPKAWLVHLKANTNTIPAHVATVVVNTASGDQVFNVDIPAFTCNGTG